MKKIKLRIAAALVGTMLASNLLPSVTYALEASEESITNEVTAQIKAEELTLDEAIGNTVEYYKTHKTSLDSFWELVALKFVGEDILSAPYEPKQWDENIINNDTFPIDDAGFILGIIARGEDPKNFHGKNVAKILADKQRAYRDGVESFNGSNFNIWAIIALEIANEDYDKEFALETLLTYQLEDGSYSLSTNSSWGGSTDLTGMALISLGLLQKDEAFKEDERIKESINKALGYLETMKTEEGTFKGYSGTPDGNSTSMAITGLVTVGEDLNSERWSGVATGILGMQVTEEDEAKGNGIKGQFYWTNSTINDMATYQCLIALGDIKSGKSAWDRLDEQYAQYEMENDKEKLPEILAENIEAKVGDKLDLLSGVTAVDTNGVDITENITIKESTVPMNEGVLTEAGVYNVTYEVVDSEGRINTKTIEVKVNEAEVEVKPEEKPEVKPEEKPEVKPEVKPDAKPEEKPENKPSLPQTGGESTLPMAVVGLTALLSGVGIKLKRK